MPCSKISCKKTLDYQVTKKILQEKIMATFLDYSHLPNQRYCSFLLPKFSLFKRILN